MESFFATRKEELLYQIPAHYMTMDEVNSIVFRYVFICYNQYRVYTVDLGGLPPAVFNRAALGMAD